MRNHYRVILILAFVFTVSNIQQKAFPQGTLPNNTYNVNNQKSDVVLKEMVENTRNQLFSAQSEIEKLQESNFELKTQLSEKKKEIEALREYKQSLEDKLNSVVTTPKEEMSSITEEKDIIIRSLNEKLAQKDKAYNELSINSLAQINSLIEDRDSKIKKLEKEAEANKNKIDNLSLKLVIVDSELVKVKNSNVLLSEQDKKIAYWKDKAEKLEQQIVSLNDKNKISESITINDKAIQIMMKNNSLTPVCFYNIGKAYQENKNYQKALENYKSAIAADASYSKAYSGMGTVYAEIGDYPNAVKYMKEYLNFVRTSQERVLVNGFIDKLESNRSSN